MKGNLAKWPVVAACVITAVVAGVPFPTPAPLVIVALAVFWAVASVRLHDEWSDVVDPVRTLHLSSGALLVTSFVLLSAVELVAVSETVLLQANLMLAGPLNLLLGYSLFRVARQGEARFRRDDVLDTAALALLPLALGGHCCMACDRQNIGAVRAEAHGRNDQRFGHGRLCRRPPGGTGPPAPVDGR